jgi:TolB-like protein/cytochrome c-type biogenesis protein CcmH/NrfG
VTYAFGTCVLDAQRRELRRNGAVLPVEPQIFDLLHYLLRNRDRVVSRDELIAAVWKGRIVSDSTLSSRISTVRTAIGDDGKQQRLVKTFSRRGVRFVADVHEVRSGGGGRSAPTVASSDRASIAVLPFAIPTGDQSQVSFANGVTEEIITTLSRGSDFSVASGNSRLHDLSETDAGRIVGRQLGVGYVLEGSVRTAGKRVRVAARLVDVDTGAYRWAERYDFELKDVFTVQDDIARAIISAITPHMARLEGAKVLLRPPETWRAPEYYARGAQTWAAFHSSFRMSDFRDTQQALNQCLSIEPAHSRAHALLAETCLVAYQFPFDESYLNPEALDKAEGASSQALRCDPQSPFAHAMAGRVFGFMGAYEESISEFEKAEKLNPSSADWRLLMALVMMGDHSRALEVGQKYIRNDPFHPPIASLWLGIANFMLGRYSDALSCLRASALRAPNLRAARVHLAATFAQLNQTKAARRQVDAALYIEPTFTFEHQKQLAAVCRHDRDIARHLEALRKAGLPD